MSAAVTTVPAVTATPSSVRLPLTGTLSMRTSARLSPSTSLNPKSDTASTCVPSSDRSIDWSAPSGASLAPVRRIDSCVVDVPPWPSLIV